MALTKITPEIVAVNAIQGTLIADNAITAVHIATNAVSGTLIADNAVTATHIAQNVITVTQLADDAVEADKIADGVITTNHLNKAMISSQTEVTAATGDFLLIGDTSDSNNLKKVPVSGVTGLVSSPITALNSATANELVTVGSTTTELDAENNLTFDGSELSVSRELSSDTTTTPDTVLTLATRYASTGANGDAGAGPRLEFKIPDDETNPITGAAIAALKEDGNDSVANAALAFYISQDDTTLDEMMRIKSDGNIGIGPGDASTDPYANVHIADGSPATLLIQMDADTTGGEAQLLFKADSTGPGGLGDDRIKAGIMFRRTGSYGVGDLHFCMEPNGNNTNVSNSNSKMTITQAGKVWAEGHVMQVVQATGGAEIMTSGTFNETGLEADITPLKASSKVLVTVTSSATYNNGTAGLGIAIFRGATEVCHHVVGGSSGNQYFPISMSFLDSPNTTSAITYTVQHRSENGSSLVGFVSTDPGGDDVGFLQLMEIGGA